MNIDQRILEALHIDGRASWQRIAQALGANERTIARHGNALLASGTVRVVAITVPALGAIVALRCGPGQARMTSSALAGDGWSMWAHVTTGDFDVLGFVAVPERYTSTFLLDRLPALPGLRESRMYPVVNLLRTAQSLRIGVLGDAERAQLSDQASSPEQIVFDPGQEIEARDQILIAALREDGRRTFEELGRLAGMSDVTAKRRVDALRRQGAIQIRAVIDPAAFGLTTELVMLLDVPPRHAAATAESLLAADQITFAAQLAGQWSFVVKVTVRGREDIDALIRSAPWLEHASRTSIAIAMRTDIRNTVRQPPSL